MRAKFAFAFVLLAVVGLYQCAQPPTAVTPPPESKAKKLIYYGWGSPDTMYVRDHWREMEEMPFDGVGIVVPLDRRAWQQGKRDTGNQLGWQLMGKKGFRIEDFRDTIADLKAANWRKFTDNFLPVAFSSCVSARGLNWFDDQRWSAVANNFAVLARIAVEGGIKGLILDPEHYGKCELFYYPDQQRQHDEPFEAYKKMARQRGREVMTAIGAAMPEAVLFSLFGNTLPLSELRRDKSVNEVRYGLLPAFYDGFLEAMPAGSYLVDGYEFGFPFKERKQFVDGYRRIYHTALALSTVPDHYRQKVRAGFGLWIDYKKNPRYLTPEEFQRAVRDALDVSDRYVWIYSQGPRFFPISGIDGSYIKAMLDAQLRAR